METKKQLLKELEKNEAKITKLNERTQALFNKIAKQYLGERWECRYLSRRSSYCELTFSFNDKNGWPTELNLLYDANNTVYENGEWKTLEPQVTMNVSAMGSFAINSADSREATYYAAVGTIMTNKNLKNKMNRILAKYYEDIKELNHFVIKYRNICNELD